MDTTEGPTEGPTHFRGAWLYTPPTLLLARGTGTLFTPAFE